MKGRTKHDVAIIKKECRNWVKETKLISSRLSCMKYKSQVEVFGGYKDYSSVWENKLNKPKICILYKERNE